MKVLLIEDEVKAVQSLKKGLVENNIAVEFAYDGYTGRLLAERGDFDVIVSDVIMPNMNGFDLVKHLRNMGINTPVILLTALGTMQVARGQVLPAGATLLNEALKLFSAMPARPGRSGTGPAAEDTEPDEGGNGGD